ncbi:DNA mismatch endonuclease Vsr [Pseudomonas sp. RIT-To-2]|uniref:DNA mismatch endonuclease Vsr n=1 Tax=Pseudomonas sp. RIT-To-2 TaxID=3462541 RepID=UPI0024130670
MCANIFDSLQRSRNMARIRSSDTQPEKNVRSICHAIGFRFRLHCATLPGTPDLVFTKHKLCLFVHGCFWHRHSGCKFSYMPKTNVEFWLKKFQSNQQRDIRVELQLISLGWRVMVVWECELRNQERLTARLLSEIPLESMKD